MNDHRMTTHGAVFDVALFAAGGEVDGDDDVFAAGIADVAGFVIHGLGVGVQGAGIRSQVYGSLLGLPTIDVQVDAAIWVERDAFSDQFVALLGFAGGVPAFADFTLGVDDAMPGHVVRFVEGTECIADLSRGVWKASDAGDLAIGCHFAGGNAADGGVDFLVTCGGHGC